MNRAWESIYAYDLALANAMRVFHCDDHSDRVP